MKKTASKVLLISGLFFAAVLLFVMVGVQAAVCTETNCPPPTDPTPFSGAENISLTPTLRWNSVSGAMTYVVNIWDPSTNQYKWVENTEGGISSNVPSEANLETGKSYNWHVRACVSESCSGTPVWSSTWLFTTAGSPLNGGSNNGGSDTCLPGQICNPLGYNTIEELVNKIIDFLIMIGIPLAAIMFVIAGFYFVTAAGDPEKVKTARHIMIYTAVGLAVILLASGLIKVIQSVLQG